jgi:opacity protein-like surface antigen
MLLPRAIPGGQRDAEFVPPLSHEFAYALNTTDVKMRIESPDFPVDELAGDATIRQFSYNLLVHPRPKGARLRPYAAIGPAVQLLQKTGETKKSSRLLKIAFRDLSFIESNWEFGRRPPLEGGGIFQVGLQYGGGVKFHVTHKLVVRADFRETMSRQPDFWTRSYTTIRNTVEDGFLEPGRLTLDGPLRHQRFSLGIGLGF